MNRLLKLRNTKFACHHLHLDKSKTITPELLDKSLTHMKEKFREVVVFRGINHREQLVIIMANPLTDSWTALQSLQGLHLCIVAYGKSGAVLPSVEGKKL